MISQHEWNEATARGEEALRTQPLATSVSYDAARNLITVSLNWGYSITFSPQRSQALASATPEELAQLEIDPPGFSIYFPLLDDGFLVASMVAGRFGNDLWEAAWAAAHRRDQAA